MRITDVEVIEFRTTTHSIPSKWTYGIWGEGVQSTRTVTKVSTD